MSLSGPETKTVVHMIDSLGRVGGAEQQLVENLKRFGDPRLRHRVLCLYELTDDSRHDELPRDTVVDYLFAEGERPPRPKIILDATRALKRIGPDLIHCGLPNAALGARIAGRQLGVPVVESLVNISHENVRTTDNPAVSSWKLAVHRTVDRFTMARVARFQALSRAVARSWVDTVGIPADRVVVIPRGVDTDQYGGSAVPEIRDALLRDLEVDLDALVLLNVGRQVAQKGQIYAVRALAKVQETHPNTVLLSAGTTGPMSEPLREEAERLGLSGKVHWLGVRADIPALLGAADVYVYPSLFEGLGVSLLQAMAAGLPVVTTDVAPMTEVVQHGENGLLVPAQDPVALAAAVVDLASNPATARRLGAAARQTIIDGFDADVVTDRVEGMYLELLAMEAP